MSFEDLNNKEVLKGKILKNLLGGKASDILYNEKNQSFLRRIIKKGGLLSDLVMLSLSNVINEPIFDSKTSYSEDLEKSIKENNELASLQKKTIPEIYRKEWFESRTNQRFNGFLDTEKGQRLKQEIAEFKEDVFKTLFEKNIKEGYEFMIKKDVNRVLENIENIKWENKDDFLKDYEIALREIDNFIKIKVGNNLDEVKWEKREDDFFDKIKFLSMDLSVIRDVMPNEDQKISKAKEYVYKEEKELREKYTKIEEEKINKILELKNKIAEIKEKDDENEKEYVNKYDFLLEIKEELINYVNEALGNKEYMSFYEDDFIKKRLEKIEITEERKQEIYDEIKKINNTNDKTGIEDIRWKISKLIQFSFSKLERKAKQEDIENKKAMRKAKRLKRKKETENELFKFDKEIAIIEAKADFDKKRVMKELDVLRNKLETAKKMRFEGERLEDWQSEVGQYY